MDWFRQSEIGQSRSSVLNPLQWGLVILIGGAVGSHLAGSPQWITTLLALAVVANFILFIFAYIYFMAKDPDALRSESYSLSKLAIQRGLIGDNIHGTMGASVVASDSKPMLSAPSAQAEKDGSP
jgi:hypothetical protein